MLSHRAGVVTQKQTAVKGKNHMPPTGARCFARRGHLLSSLLRMNGLHNRVRRGHIPGHNESIA
eukprot:4309873-Pleurochrysis_carterae.AAC.2